MVPKIVKVYSLRTMQIFSVKLNNLVLFPVGAWKG